MENTNELNVRPEFAVHMLNQEGKEKAAKIAIAFHNLLEEISSICPEGREMSIVKTKLEEASFFAKKAMAKNNCQ
jgi:hypothetical protein